MNWHQLVEIWRFITGRCIVDGAKCCEHFDYRSGRVTFFRCCKCKLRSSFEIAPEIEP